MERDRHAPLINALKAIVGPSGLIVTAPKMRPYRWIGADNSTVTRCASFAPKPPQRYHL
jgi:hypothetical protein